MNKGPIVDNRAYNFYAPFLSFNNPNITNISFKKKFINFFEYHWLKDSKHPNVEPFLIFLDDNGIQNHTNDKDGDGDDKDLKKNTDNGNHNNNENESAKHFTCKKKEKSCPITDKVGIAKATTVASKTMSRLEKLELLNIHLDMSKMNDLMWTKLEETDCENILLTGNFHIEKHNNNHIIHKCKRLLINTTSDTLNNMKAPSVEWINKTFPNIIELYANSVSFGKNSMMPEKASSSLPIVHFKYLKRFTCYTLEIDKFFERVTFNEEYIEEINIYYTNVITFVDAPAWIKNIQILRIPNSVILPIDYMDNYTKKNERILQYIYRAVPRSYEIASMRLPNISKTAKIESILFPIQPPPNNSLLTGKCSYKTGIYIFDPRLPEAIKQVTKDNPLYIHSIKICSMTVVNCRKLDDYLEPSLRRMLIHSSTVRKIAVSNVDIFKDHFDFSYWDMYILKEVDCVVLQKTIQTDINGLCLSASETYKIIYDIQSNVLMLITSTVQLDYLINHLIIINNRLKKYTSKTKKIIVTKGFSFDANIQNTINKSMDENIKFVTDAIHFDNFL